MWPCSRGNRPTSRAAVAETRPSRTSAATLSARPFASTSRRHTQLLSRPSSCPICGWVSRSSRYTLLAADQVRATRRRARPGRRQRRDREQLATARARPVRGELHRKVPGVAAIARTRSRSWCAIGGAAIAARPSGLQWGLPVASAAPFD